MSMIARVALEISLNKEFDYQIPEAMREAIAVGMQVLVPFGRNRTCRGMVTELLNQSPHTDLKPIEKILTSESLVHQRLMELARWMSDYYVAPLEKAIAAVLPSVVRKKSGAFKKQWFIKLSEPPPTDEQVEQLRKRACRQAEILDWLRAKGGVVSRKAMEQELKLSLTMLRSLEEKGFIALSRNREFRDPFQGHQVLPTQPLTLMAQQKDALDLILKAADTLVPSVVLLHGVTGSGKTEVYLQAIQHVMEQDKTVIMLVPEISLTPQTIERFRSRFGEDIAVLHSSLSEGERHDEWHRIHEGKARIVIGARSALFAPLTNIGLIVVDEEHEPSYKQSEMPRYHARDVAVMRGMIEKCAVVLGTATPSLESYHNAATGKYGLAVLPHRVDHREMPLMRIVDMRVEAEREGKINVLSRDLVEAIHNRLSRAEQTILFLNRRGYSTSLVCPKCGYVANCGFCSVSMTYHQHAERLICHICGQTKEVPSCCPAPDCRDPAFKYAGVGTQRVEKVVAKMFPRAKVVRMDSDTTVRKGAHHKILTEFKNGNIDILVGTQMIAKGLHFPNVTLVGIVFADMSLHMPDFRAGERTFQLLTQVAGRAGRGDVHGEVIVQTYTPHHLAVQAARKLDYEGFFDQEVEFRRELNYPPFSRFVLITLRGHSEEKVQFVGEAFVKELTKHIPPTVSVAGPVPSPLSKAKGLYRFQIMIRTPAIKTIMTPMREALDKFKWPKEIQYAVDVDAISLM